MMGGIMRECLLELHGVRWRVVFSLVRGFWSRVDVLWDLGVQCV
jgi:hypothetical protein